MTQFDSMAQGALTTGRTLALGAMRGLWPLEALDNPPRSPQDVRSINVRTPAPHRNLAREWIAANPKEWELMMRDSLDAETVVSLTCP